MSHFLQEGQGAPDGAVVDFTTAFIRAKGPCAGGFRWYLRHHADGGSYQKVLDSLVAAGRVDDACWLLDQLGPTTTLLRVDELVGDAIVFAGAIEARRGIEVDTVLRAGRSIRSGGSVCAGSAIVAGGDLHARGVVRSGGTVDVAGNMWAAAGAQAGSRLHCAGRLKAESMVASGSGLCVLGDISLRDDLFVQGSAECARAVRVGGRIAISGDLRVGHGIQCGQDIAADGHLEAGLGIRAGGDVNAGRSIRAGESIRAEGELRAGTGYGVYAGLSVPLDTWDSSALVEAASRPERLLSGCWRERSHAFEASMEP